MSSHKVKILIHIGEGREVQEFVSEVDYAFKSGEFFQVEDTEIVDYQVLNSK